MVLELLYEFKLIETKQPNLMMIFSIKRVALVAAFMSFNTSLLQADEVPTRMAEKGKLLFDDQGEAKRGEGIKMAPVNDKWNVRAVMGIWEKKDGFFQSSWKPGIGHTPVMAFFGDYKNVVIEVSFRYNEMKEDWHTGVIETCAIFNF